MQSLFLLHKLCLQIKTLKLNSPLPTLSPQTAFLPAPSPRVLSLHWVHESNSLLRSRLGSWLQVRKIILWNGTLPFLLLRFFGVTMENQGIFVCWSLNFQVSQEAVYVFSHTQPTPHPPLGAPIVLEAGAGEISSFKEVGCPGKPGGRSWGISPLSFRWGSCEKLRVSLVSWLVLGPLLSTRDALIILNFIVMFENTDGSWDY